MVFFGSLKRSTQEEEAGLETGSEKRFYGERGQARGMLTPTRTSLIPLPMWWKLHPLWQEASVLTCRSGGKALLDVAQTLNGKNFSGLGNMHKVSQAPEKPHSIGSKPGRNPETQKILPG